MIGFVSVFQSESVLGTRVTASHHCKDFLRKSVFTSLFEVVAASRNQVVALVVNLVPSVLEFLRSQLNVVLMLNESLLLHRCLFLDA